jgi:DNA polymerase III alpha subunit
MEGLFADLPEAVHNSGELSARLSFELDALGYEFPRYPVGTGETMNSYLRDRALEGMNKRYGIQSCEIQQRGTRPSRKRAGDDRKARTCGLFSDRLGSDSVLL